MLRGCSVSANLMANIMNTGSGSINKMHNHSAPENAGGHLSCQNGAEAATETPSHTRERMANNRVLGLPTD